MDILGFVTNILDAAGYIIKFADQCMNVKSAPSDIRYHIEDLKNRAFVAQQCAVAMQSWTDNGEVIPAEYLRPANNARKAYEEASLYLQEKLRHCEEGNGAMRIFGRAQFAAKGKERATFVARRVVDTTDTLKHLVDMRVHLMDTTLSTRFRPFLDRAWKHSVDEKIVKPLKDKTEYLSEYARTLDYGDCIAVGKPSGFPMFEDRVFVRRNPGSKEEDTQLLASLLSADVDGVGKKFGLLQCVGYINCYVSDETRETQETRETYSSLVFKRPNATRDPLTLRELLLKEESRKHTLCDRLKFALTVTTSLVIHHSLGIVHKSISPESILIFPDMIEGDEQKRYYQLGTPYLLAFDQARSEKTRSGRLHTGERNERRNFYIYPEHLWTHRTRSFETKDDVYGLGICLLEIGLWRSIFKVTKDASDKDFERPEFDDWAKDLTSESLRRKGDEVKWRRVEQLVELARNELPKTMGIKYTSAVIACLVMDLPDEHRYKRIVDEWEAQAEADAYDAGEERLQVDSVLPARHGRKSRHRSSTTESLRNAVQTCMLVPSLISSYRTKRKLEQAARELWEDTLLADEKKLLLKDGSDDTVDVKPETPNETLADSVQTRRTSNSASDNVPNSDVNQLSRKSRQNLAFVTDVLKRLYSVRV